MQEIKPLLMLLESVSNDATDALLAYLDEKDDIKKEVLFKVYKKKYKLRADIAKKISELCQK